MRLDSPLPFLTRGRGPRGAANGCIGSLAAFRENASLCFAPYLRRSHACVARSRACSFPPPPPPRPQALPSTTPPPALNPRSPCPPPRPTHRIPTQPAAARPRILAGLKSPRGASVTSVLPGRRISSRRRPTPQGGRRNGAEA